MNSLLFDNTKVISYFLWEYTNHDNALNLWYCAEDLACYFERLGIFNTEAIAIIKAKGRYDLSYINFIRHIAFRVFFYTANPDSLLNWFTAERLLNNAEWCEAITNVADIYNKSKSETDFKNAIRSSSIKTYYNGFSK